MAHPAVRNWFRSQLVTRVPSIPYIDTINKAPNPENLPDIWVTMEFANSSEQRVSLGSPACWREFGEATFIVLGKSGKTDVPVLTAALTIRTAFLEVREMIAVAGVVNGQGKLVFDADTPNTDSTENGNWFLASVACSYTLDTYR